MTMHETLAAMRAAFMDELPVTATQKLQNSRIFAPGEDPTRRPGMFDCRPLKQARRAQ